MNLVENSMKDLNNTFQHDVALLIDKYYDLKNLLFYRDKEIKELKERLFK